jgi:SAM-dependent methyltransferase
MVEVSRDLNPDCEHHVGDMRDVRLGRTFDAVFMHDAISYLTSLEDILRAFETAALHCRPGGVLIAVPDNTTETFQPRTSCGGHDGDGRSFRYLQWEADEDPEDQRYETDFAFMLREGSGAPRLVEDRHVLGLFPEKSWLEQMAEAGFLPRTEPFRHSSFGPDERHTFFVGIRRGEGGV